MAVRGEHVYIRFTNPFIARSYLFHIPLKVLCMIVKNRVIEKEEYEYKTKEELDKIEEEKKEEKINSLGIYQ